MSKLGKFAAACAAVVCAFGAEAAATPQFSQLPKEYAEVEYIASSTATEYIDLGVHFKANQTFQLEWANDSLNGLNNEDKGWGTGGGVNGNNNWNITGGGRRNSGYLRPYIYAGNRELKTTANGQFLTSSLKVGDWFVDTCGITNKTLYYAMRHVESGEVYAISTLQTPTDPFDSGNNIHLFKDDSQSSPFPGKKRIRAAKLWNNTTGEPVADMVAARRLTDNKPGLYDLARGTFFVNQGTGADFTIGLDTADHQNTLEFDGEPATLGALTPGWGAKYVGLADGELISCSAPVCDGSVDRDPIGWTLYVRNAEDVWVQVEEGSGLSYDYVHEAGRRAKLVWRWDVPGVARSRVTAVTATSFTIAADVTTLGATATEAQVRVAWGRSPDALAFTNEIATVTTTGPVGGTVSVGVMPLVCHYAKVLIESADGASEDSAEPVEFRTPNAFGATVPPEYETVEYIESRGAEWIDTTVNSSPKINIDLDIQYVTVPQGNTCFFGERVSQGRHFALWASSANYRGAVINYGSYDPGAAGATGVDMYETHHVLSNREGDMYVDGELKSECSGYTWTSGNDYSLYLFVMRNGTDGRVDNRNFAGKVYGLKMWERQADGQPDRLLRDFVPVRRIADNAYGLYDLVEGQFHGNIGGGALKGGAHIPGPNSLLTITADPEEEGAADPAYGVYESLTAGETLTFFAPVATAGGYLSCLGATVYTNAADDATAWLPWQELQVANGRVTYVHPENSNAKLVWHITAANPLGLGAVTLASAGFNSLDLSVDVTGLGFESDAAELTLNYGVVSEELPNAKTVTVDAKGATTVTLHPLVPGTTYYVKATLANAEGSVESSVLQFTVPAFHEEEAGRRIAYYHVQGVAACDSAVYAYGDTRLEIDFTVVNSIAQSRIFTAGDYETIRAQDLAFALYENGGKGFVFCLSASGTTTKETGVYPPAGGHYLASLDGTELTVSLVNAETGKVLSEGVVSATLTKDSKSRYPVVFGSRPVNENPLTLNEGTVSDARYHAVRIYRAGELVSNIIAFRRASDGKTGLYDTFTRKFLNNVAGNDQAVFEASPDAEATGRTILGTTLARTGVKVALGGDAVAATLYRVSGNAYGGDDPAAWTDCTSLGELAASTTETLSPLPEGWDDGSVLTRFFAVSDVSGTAVTNWSETVFWQDTDEPIFAGDLELDGTGGDTLVVRGGMDNLGGESCTLTVYTGSSADDLTVAWTGLDGSTLTEAGAFELTLFVNDPAAPNYIAPGREFFATVEARAGQKVARSRVMSVTTAGGGWMTARELQIAHRDIIAQYAIETLGASGVNRVELWAGTSAEQLERVEYADVDAPGFGSLVHQFAEFGTYYWQLRYVNATAGGTANWNVSSTPASARLVDMSVYTWKQTVAEGAWTNAANWETDHPGDCLGYPQTDKATAKFAADTVARVTVDADVTCGSLDCTVSGYDVTLVGDGEHVLNANVNFGEEFGTVRSESRIVLDGIKVTARSSVSMNGGLTVELVNGAEMSVNGGFRLTPNLQPPLGNPHLKIGESSKLSVSSNLDLDSDALVELAGTLQVAGIFLNSGLNGNLIGGGRVRLVGENPQLQINASGDQCRSHGSYRDVPRGGFEFILPKKGYRRVPVVGSKIDFVLNDNSQGIVMRVLDESPAFLRGTDQIFQLMSFASVNTNRLAFQTLKRENRGSTFLYATDATEPVWTLPSETTETPTAIGVKTIGTKGLMIMVQ